MWSRWIDRFRWGLLTFGHPLMPLPRAVGLLSLPILGLPGVMASPLAPAIPGISPPFTGLGPLRPRAFPVSFALRLGVSQTFPVIFPSSSPCRTFLVCPSVGGSLFPPLCGTRGLLPPLRGSLAVPRHGGTQEWRLSALNFGKLWCVSCGSMMIDRCFFPCYLRPVQNMLFFFLLGPCMLQRLGASLEQCDIQSGTA